MPKLSFCQVFAWRRWQCAFAGVLILCINTAVLGQTPDGPTGAFPEGDVESSEAAPAEDQEPIREETPGINLLSLIGRGGWLMLPIGIMSVLVVAFFNN